VRLYTHKESSCEDQHKLSSSLKYTRMCRSTRDYRFFSTWPTSSSPALWWVYIRLSKRY